MFDQTKSENSSSPILIAGSEGTSGIQWPLVVCIFALPLYFYLLDGFYLPVFGLVLCTPLIIKSFLTDKSFFYATLFYVFLALVQISIVPEIEFGIFFRKILAIFLFIATYFLFSNFYEKRYDKYLLLSLFTVVTYGIYAAPSYLLGYQDLLIPGTCPSNNRSDIGHLRCATFGEGNYFGSYVAILILLFTQSRPFMMLCFIGALISWAPVPLIIYCYGIYKLTLHALISDFHGQWSRVITAIILIVLAIFVWVNFKIIADIFINAPERSSLGERTEFIRAGFSMWLENPSFGVGIGHYGNVLPEFTILPHLAERTVYEDARFISNSNIIEFLAEQGFFGFMFYIYILARSTKFQHPLFSRLEILAILIVIGVAMPTFFQVIIAAMLGIMSSRNMNFNAKM